MRIKDSYSGAAFLCVTQCEGVNVLRYGVIVFLVKL